MKLKILIKTKFKVSVKIDSNIKLLRYILKKSNLRHLLFFVAVNTT